ncbi:MAG: SDR family NAD(P)-dependent oxidoreductase [Gammaproteobacteria bacterium]|nr:SDR family NAD(P)-dependent oxidoreductase [Gammaproteobacteria bacterium]MDH5511806.1 SDR family NAD(P)-dependent oxidoreductase [Gammaproteobacteria bacterium]
MSSLKDRVIIITGAVGNLGSAVVRRVRAQGGRMVLVDRSDGRLKKTHGDLKGDVHHWLASGVDLTDPKAASDMAAEAFKRFGRIDGLVNTVGGFRGGKPVHEADLAEWDFLYDINVRTVLNACRAVIPYMLKAQGGRIINIASRNAFQGSPNYAAYSATKGMVLRMSESMAGELKTRGINVNCIVPGTIDTPQNRAAMPQADFSAWVPPEDLASVIAFLLSDDARSVTGTAVPVYGRS